MATPCHGQQTSGKLRDVDERRVEYPSLLAIT
jgi:hypothetical protein